MSQSRPIFNPLPCSEPDRLQLVASSDSPETVKFLSVIECQADFPPEFFQAAMLQIIEHPEYNSTLILRSEILSDISSRNDQVLGISGYNQSRIITRSLVPRRPGRDGPVKQDCRFYASLSSTSEDDALVDLVILTPCLSEGEELPYYHPAVHHLAFRYLKNMTKIIIELVPKSPPPNDVFDPSSRLYRTCLALLDTCHRYMWGLSNDYQKRVMHDCIIPREIYQDLYLVMRERWKGMVNDWKEVTDPRKHVFEVISYEKDIAIATYLMLLWREMYSSPQPPIQYEDLSSEPWKKWPRPEDGFVDIGCGNGLLTHILVSEGYKGIGFDVRARVSWGGYSHTTKEALFISGLNPCEDIPRLPANFAAMRLPSKPTSPGSPFNLPTPRPARKISPLSGSSTIPPSPTNIQHIQINPKQSSDEMVSDIPLNISSEPLFHPGQFLISNHADELTPWTPLLATLHQSSGYINIPCCPWTFDRRFERGSENQWGIPPPFSTLNEFATSLNLGNSGDLKSGYSQYRMWLGALGFHCGWVTETDVLRIPSTRGWALIGRKKNLVDGFANVRGIMDQVTLRGDFKIRIPEGKAGDH